MSDGTKAALERQERMAEASLAAKELAAPDAKEWLASVIEFLPDATFVVDRDKRIVAWNRACEIMTGVRKEALLGQGDYAYAEPFLGERRPILVDLLDMPSPEVEARYKYVQRKGDVIYAESFASRLRNGQGAHLWGEAAALFDREGRRQGAIEVIRDVSEQKHVEQALQDSRERLLKAQRVARVGFLDWDLKTNQIFLSDETCELTGFRPEGQVTTPDFVARSVHPDDLAYTGENLNLAISGAKPYDIVHRHVRPDGGIVWVHAQAEIYRDEAGAPARLLGTIVDITEQKRVEQALRESERKYRELVEHANSIILHWTRDGRVIFLNEFGQRFFGYSEAEIRGRHVMGTIVPETESSGRDLRSLMDEICKDPAAFEQNVNENIRRNGDHVWVAWTNKVVLDAQGQVKEILSIGADITARKNAEEKLQQLNLELEQRVRQRTAELNASNDRLRSRNAELKGFAYTVSHDLKAPLRGIAGYANELERKHREGMSDRARFCTSQILSRHLQLGPPHRRPTPLFAPGCRDAFAHRDQSARPGPDHPVRPKPGHHRTARRCDGGSPLHHDADLGTGLGAGDDQSDRQRHQVQPQGQSAAAAHRGRSSGRRLAAVRQRQRHRVRHEVPRSHFRTVQPIGTHGGVRGNRRRSGHRQEGLDKVGGTVRAESSPGAGATFLVDIPNPGKAA